MNKGLIFLLLGLLPAVSAHAATRAELQKNCVRLSNPEAKMTRNGERILAQGIIETMRLGSFMVASRLTVSLDPKDSELVQQFQLWAGSGRLMVSISLDSVPADLPPEYSVPSQLKQASPRSFTLGPTLTLGAGEDTCTGFWLSWFKDKKVRVSFWF